MAVPSPSHQNEPRRDEVLFAVVDVETSGLNPAHDHLLQVAVVTVDLEGVIHERWSSLVRPPRGIWGRVGPTHIHGLSRWSMLGSPRAHQVLPDIARRFEGRVIVAHNLGFDLAFLQAAADATATALPTTPVLCTLELSRHLDRGRQLRHRLGDICERYGIALDRPHDALADAEATAQVLIRLLREAGVENLDTLTQLIAAQSASS
jgi:DNA polymerase III alpha subunit (gram-positive type)